MSQEAVQEVQEGLHNVLLSRPNGWYHGPFAVDHLFEDARPIPGREDTIRYKSICGAMYLDKVLVPASGDQYRCARCQKILEARRIREAQLENKRQAGQVQIQDQSVYNQIQEAT